MRGIMNGDMRYVLSLLVGSTRSMISVDISSLAYRPLLFSHYTGIIQLDSIQPLSPNVAFLPALTQDPRTKRLH